MGFFSSLGKLFSCSSNYRKTALQQANRDRWGNVEDVYTGKYHKPKNMDADHIFPKSRGGCNCSWNLGMTHKSINRSKGNKIQPSRMVRGYAKNPTVRKATKITIGASLMGHMIDSASDGSLF